MLFFSARQSSRVERRYWMKKPGALLAALVATSIVVVWTLSLFMTAPPTA